MASPQRGLIAPAAFIPVAKPLPAGEVQEWYGQWIA
jgi:hypothetical protein